MINKVGSSYTPQLKRTQNFGNNTIQKLSKAEIKEMETTSVKKLLEMSINHINETASDETKEAFKQFLRQTGCHLVLNPHAELKGEDLIELGNKIPSNKPRLEPGRRSWSA